MCYPRVYCQQIFPKNFLTLLIKQLQNFSPSHLDEHFFALFNHEILKGSKISISTLLNEHFFWPFHRKFIKIPEFPEKYFSQKSFKKSPSGAPVQYFPRASVLEDSWP